MTTITTRALTPDDEPAVLDLLQDSLAGGPTGERTSDFFAWKHRDSPFGASPGLVAESDGRLVGVRLLMRWQFALGDRDLTAVRMVDTATAPDMQGKGIFKRLTLEALEQHPTDIVFNTPNTQSLPGYLKMGWQVVGQVPIALRPARPLALASAVARRSVGQSAVTGPVAPLQSPLPTASEVLADPRVAALAAELESGADASRLRTRRTPAFLTWRYGSAPGLDYRAVPVERGGELVGLGLGRLRRRGPLSELTLGDVLVRPGDKRSARAVLRATRKARTDVVSAAFAARSEAGSSALAGGFVTVPRQGLTLTSRPTGTQLPVDPARLVAWQLSLGDLELF